MCVSELENSLMNQNHFRDCGVQVQDNLHYLDPIIIEHSHQGEEFIACLKSEGTNTFFKKVWNPSERDLR